MTTPISHFYEVLRQPIASYLEQQAALPVMAPEPTPQQIRDAVNKNIVRLQQKSLPIHHVKDYRVETQTENLTLRVYMPFMSKSPLPILVYYHGGGWVAGNIETHDNVCRFLSDQCQCIVVSVDYPLAPEHKFSKIIESCYEALQWVYQHAEELRGDKDRIAVGGDSAGGNLTAVMTLMAKDRKLPWKITYQLLICPATNLQFLDTPSYLSCSDYGLSREKMLLYRNFYLEHEAEASHYYASPLLAPDLSNLPPALVVTSEYDVLHDEGCAYAKRLKQAGIETTYYCMEKMIHSGVFWGVASPIISEDLEFVCRTLKEHL